MSKRSLFLLLKAAISFLILAYLLRDIDFNGLHAAITNADRSLLIAAFLLHGVGYTISAFRWQLLLHSIGQDIPILFLVKSALAATFVNNLLPTTVGGDTLRAHDTARYTNSPFLVALGVTTVDRLVGFFALFIFSAAALLGGVNKFLSQASISSIILIMAMFFIAVGLFFSRPVSTRLESKLAVRLGSTSFQKPLDFYRAILMFQNHQLALFYALIMSLTLQANVVVHYYLISMALRQDVSLLYFFLFVPILIAILQVAPSLNGIGYREAGFIIFLTQAGVDSASALTLSLLAFGMTFVQSIIGGVMFALRQEKVGLRSKVGV